MKNRSMYLLVAGLVTIMLIFSAQTLSAETKDKIRVGWVTSLSGVNAPGVMITSGNVYKMWVEEINAKGGLMIKEYGKRLPLDVIMYDDKSDVGTMTKLLEKTIMEDKVDLLFAPWDTAFHFAAAPIASKHKMVLMGASGGAVKLKKVIKKFPYYFHVLNSGDDHIPAAANVFGELGIKTVYIAYIQDLHGLEYNEVTQKEFPKKGIKIVAAKSFPLDLQDFTPLLKEAKASGADAFMGFLYPQNAFPCTGQAMEVGYNPKAFYMTVGPCLAGFRDAFTAKGIDGVMGAGAWSPKTSPGAKDFFERYTKRWGMEPEGWGTLMYYSSLQFFGQAIEEAGTLDQTKIKQVMETKTFQTALGDFSFPNHIFQNYPGLVGQWQNGTWEVIDVGAKRTAKPMFPKPEWAPPPPAKK